MTILVVNVCFSINKCYGCGIFLTYALMGNEKSFYINSTQNLKLTRHLILGNGRQIFKR